LCSVFQDKTEALHKVTIIPRGFTGGATHSLVNDKMTYSKTYLNQILVTLMGGRCAEEIVFEEMTTGAGNDIQRATDLAKKMVCNWGMSEKIGPMTVGAEDRQVFLGKDFVQHESLSEATAQLVDAEIRNTVLKAHELATKILLDHRKLLDVMAEILLEKETLNIDEIFEIIIKEIDDHEKEFIEKKYKKACDMKIDVNQGPGNESQDSEEENQELEQENQETDHENQEPEMTETELNKENPKQKAKKGKL